MIKEINTSHDSTADKWYTDRIEYLSGFLLPDRYKVLEQTAYMRTRYMTILAENTFHAHNASALVRHCEAFGVQDIHTVEALCEFQPYLNIVKGSDKWIDIIQHNSTHDALAHLKSEGYRVVAATPHTEDSIPEDFDATKGKFVLVFGTEKQGLSDEVIEAADEFIRIPMCGMVESLNVSACAAILIYMSSSKVREGDIDWRLPREEHLSTMYKWVRSSVKDGDALLTLKYKEDK